MTEFFALLIAVFASISSPVRAPRDGVPSWHDYACHVCPSICMVGGVPKP